MSDVVWDGRIGKSALRVGVPHAGSIIAEWETPRGPRHKVSDSVEEFERAVLFQLLLGAGGEDPAAEEVIAAIKKAQAERPKRTSDPSMQRRRKNPRARQHRRSRTPPRRR
jgi:hypothetical protein